MNVLCSDASTELEEDGVRIALTVVDTPGFGDNIDNEFACVFPGCRQGVANGVQTASRKLLDTSSVNTTTFWRKSLESSVTRASGTTAFTLFCTSSPLLDMRKRSFLLPIRVLTPA